MQLKGGVWKNSEDEILKAAVMKYGLNQWSRVASLLPRKTPKQCKARWIEWLDPNVKKTEWTREEEERLLHLAKLMPAQWRTIAPLVGRTPAQCIEHYEKLLDAAQGAEAKDKKDDPRRLRPGEIDPQPEIKPARPDPVDMDEDEKEMLSEARARLANTQGKKAKRKVRERMLEEAKRLAQLQKQRELKAAGINVDGKRKKRKMEGIDYANEIPFEKRAPAGFFDTTDDDVAYADQKAAETADFKTTLLNKIEKERGAAAEAKAKADDKRKFKEMAASNLPDLLRAEAEKDPLNLRKRAPLLMPAPSVTDGELEDIARIGMRAGQAGILGGGYMLENGGDGGSVVTQGLLMPASSGMGVGEGDIEGTIVGLAASRRGATVPTRDAIMEEARNQAAQLSMQTPLFGGDNVALEQGTGYAGAAPMARRMATGPRGAAAGPGGLGGYGATPMLGDAVVGATPMLMDRLGGGAGGGASVAPGHAGPGSTLTGLTGVAGLLKGGIGGAGVGVLRDQMGINKLDRLDMPPPSVRAAGQHQHHPSAPSSALMPPPPKAGAAAQRAGHEHEQDDDAASEVYPSDSASVALGDSASVVAGRVHVGHEKELMKQLAGSIVAGLAALPKPKNEYELTVPDVPAEEADLHPTGQSLGLSAAALRGADLGTLQEEEDAAEEQARLAAEEEAERQRALARRSSALKHVPALPRPLVIDDGAVAPSMSHLLRSTDAAVRERAVAESLINDEMLKLLKRDAVQYPVSTAPCALPNYTAACACAVGWRVCNRAVEEERQNIPLTGRVCTPQGALKTSQVDPPTL